MEGADRLEVSSVDILIIPCLAFMSDRVKHLSVTSWIVRSLLLLLTCEVCLRIVDVRY
jgi:hypothetical protein